MNEGCMIRVRYAETDQMGIAHHANYLTWFEAARTELLRGSGYSYADFEREGVFMPVLEAACRYLKPALYDDVLQVEPRVESLTPARLEIRYVITRGSERIAEGRTVHAFLAEGRRPVNLRKRSPRLWEVLSALAGREGQTVTAE